MKTNIHFGSYIAQLFLKSGMFQVKVIERIKTHFSFQFFFSPPPRKSCRSWDNVEKYYKPKGQHMKIWLLRIACWLFKATNTHSEYLICIAFPLQQWLHEAPQYCVMRTLPVLSPRLARNYRDSNIPRVSILAIQVSRRIPDSRCDLFK